MTIDIRIDEIEANLKLLRQEVSSLNEDILPLHDLADAMKGLHVMGRLLLWLGGIAATIATAMHFFNGGSSP